MNRKAVVFALVTVACKAAPSVPPQGAVGVAAASASPTRTVEPEHPFAVTLTVASGHEALPSAPRQDVWIGMEGIGATLPSGESGRIGALRNGGPTLSWTEDRVLPALYALLSEHPTKGTLVVWADERVPVDTVSMVIFTAEKAGFRDVAFVVGEPGAREILRAIPHTSALESADFEGPAWSDLGLRWSPQGVHATLHARYSNVEPQPQVQSVPLDLGTGTCIFPGGARPDPTVVQHVLDAMCSRGKPFALRVGLHGEDSIGDIMSTLVADRRPASCRLPTVIDVGIDFTPLRCDGAQKFATALASFPLTAHYEGIDETMATIDESQAMLDELAREEESSRGFGGKGALVPVVKVGKPIATGALDPAIIRRIVRAHIGEIRHCYEPALARDPDVYGVVEIAFTIGAKGKTIATDVASSTVTDAAVAPCIAKVARTWKFPKPSDGKPVEVRYPFHLSAE